jgi:AAA domain/DnaB-like helicase N terminal domain
VSAGVIIPPQNLAIERGVLGCLLVTEGAGLDRLTPTDFALDHHRIIFAAIRDVVAAHGRADVLAVTARLQQRDELDEVGGPVLLATLCEEEAVTASMLPTHCATLRDYAMRRAMLALGLTLQYEAGNGHDVGALLTKTQATVTALTTGLAPEGRAWTLHDAADPWDDVPLPAWIVESLLPERGVMWLAGAPHAGKSLLALYLCLAIATDQAEVAEHFVIQDRPRILFVSREDGRGRLKARRADILAPWGLTSAEVDPGRLRFIVREPVNLLDPADVAALGALCAREGITLVVFDTWTALTPGADPDGSKEQATLARIVVELADRIGGLVVVVDHTRKNVPGGVALADIYGPGQKAQRAEHALVLRRVEGEARRVEVLVDPKDLDDRPHFFLDISPMGSAVEKWLYAGSAVTRADKMKSVGDANRDRVLAAVLSSPGWASRAEVEATLAKAGTPLSRATVAGHLRDLVETGKLDQAGEGKARRYRGAGAAESSKGPSRTNEQTEAESP